MKEKVMTTLSIILMLLAMTGYTYSHWHDVTYILGTVNMGHLDPIIEEYKVLAPKDYTVSWNNHTNANSEDNRTVLIPIDRVFQDWHIWVGIVVHNEGTLPALDDITITVSNPYNITSSFNITKYYYGPYSTVPNEIWRNVTIDAFTFPPGESPPVPSDPCQRVVVWSTFYLSTTESDVVDNPIQISITTIDRLGV